MGDLGGLSLHKAITPQALWSSGSVPGTVPGPVEVAATLPSRLETDSEQEIKATLQTIQRIRRILGRTLTSPK